MNVEEIVVHCCILIATSAIMLLLFQVWKYLNSKIFGFRTVLDDLAKDGMVILGLNLTHTWITWIKFASQYNYYVALAILKMEAVFRVSLIVQALTFSITRYLFVFNFQKINNVPERNIRMSSRICVAVLAIICANFDDWTTAKKVLYLMTEDQVKEEQAFQGPRPFFSTIVTVVSMVIIAYVQVRITYQKWKYPEFQDNEAEGDKFNLKMICIVVGVSLITVIIVVSSVFAKSIVLTSLSTLLCVRLIALMTIWLLICSNERMLSFIKKRLISCKILPEPTFPQLSPSPNEASDQLPIHTNQDESIHIQGPVLVPEPIIDKPSEMSSFRYALSINDRLIHKSQPLPDAYII